MGCKDVKYLIDELISSFIFIIVVKSLGVHSKYLSFHSAYILRMQNLFLLVYTSFDKNLVLYI